MLNIEFVRKQLCPGKVIDISSHKPKIDGLKPHGEDPEQEDALIQESSYYRLQLLKAFLEYFPEELDKEEVAIPAYLDSHPNRAINAITVANYNAWRSSAQKAVDENIKVDEFVQRLNYINLGASGEKDKEVGVINKIFRIIAHGSSVMIGALEVIPKVYKYEYGAMPTESKLNTKLPSSTDRFFTAMSLMHGSMAVLLEDMFSEKIEVPTDSKPIHRHVYKQDHFEFAIDDQKDHLDVVGQYSAVSTIFPKILADDYHGCLAGSTSVESNGNKQMAFLYVRERITKLLKEYWYPELFKKKA